MIKIDGEKIKTLRESQGLTQLYMATAVDVTTDTISRWENKRYPTIKKENADKLAEALGVTVDEILLVEEVTKDNGGAHNDNASTYTRSALQLKKKRPYIIYVSAVLLICIIGAFGYFHSQQNLSEVASVTRIMPGRAIPNSPFPVVIEIQQAGNETVSIILKESLPPGSNIIETSPKNGSSFDKNEVKWIHKLQKTTRFSYLVEIDGSTDEEFRFRGSLSTSQGSADIDVSGNNLIQLGRYHWADIDGDNKISDQEILTVFDYYSGIDNFTIDIEFIEKMWLGSSYSWDSVENQISISP